MLQFRLLHSPQALYCGYGKTSRSAQPKNWKLRKGQLIDIGTPVVPFAFAVNTGTKKGTTITAVLPPLSTEFWIKQ